MALFAASNSETVEWATLRNSHYNCSDGDHKSCHPSIIASTDEHGRGACESSSAAAFCGRSKRQPDSSFLRAMRQGRASSATRARTVRHPPACKRLVPLCCAFYTTGLRTAGTFANFTETVLKPAVLSYTSDDAMAATLSWPGGLELKMAWDGPMTTNGGADVPLASHKRYDNPYVQEGGVAFPLRDAVTFTFEDQKLELDFEKGVRRTIRA